MESPESVEGSNVTKAWKGGGKTLIIAQLPVVQEQAGADGYQEFAGLSLIQPLQPARHPSRPFPTWILLKLNSSTTQKMKPHPT